MLKRTSLSLAVITALSFPLTACSGDDNASANVTPAKEQAPMKDAQAAPSEAKEKAVTDAGKGGAKKSDAVAPKEPTAEEAKQALIEKISALTTGSAIDSDVADLFSNNDLYYGLDYAPEDIENEKPVGYFITLNDTNVINDKGELDYDAFVKSLKAPEDETWDQEKLEALTESAINIVAESLLMNINAPKEPEDSSTEESSTPEQ